MIPSLLLAILGFRSTTKAVSIGMLAGALSVIVWLYIITPYNKIDGIVPSAFTNLVAFVGAHYLLRQPGGWIKTYNPSNSYRPKSKSLREKVLAFSIFKDGLLKYCSKQTPKNDIVYLYFAFASLFTIVVTLTLKKEIYINNFAIITLIQAITLLVATIFFCNKLWPSKLREKYIGLTWYISIFSVLSFNSCFLVLITNSSQTSLIMYILSLTMIGALLNWQSSLVLSIFGVASSFVFYKLFIGDVPNVADGIYDSKLKI